MKTLILVPESSSGLYGILYTTAKSFVKSNKEVVVTTNWRRAIREHSSFNKVVIIMGSRGKSLSDTYETLKEAHPEMIFILINSFVIKTRKKDKMVLFTGKRLQETIKEYL